MTSLQANAPYFLDCDTGIDDALALAYLLGAGANLVGIGSVSGNTDALQGATNTLNLLELAGHGHVPVALGHHHPQAGTFGGGAPHVHGANGIGEVQLPDSGLELAPETAPEMLVRLAREHRGELRVIAIGPLTNIAAALRLDPELPGLIRELTIMGGAAMAPGNITPASEANIHNDPEAAAEVFAADWEIVLVPLDVTMNHVLEEADLERLQASDSPAVQAVGSMLGYYFDFYKSVFGRRCSVMHDPLAAAIALGRVQVTSAPYARVVVDATDGPGRGQTICDMRGLYKGYPKPAGAHCRVVLTAEATAIDEIMRGTLALADAPSAARPVKLPVAELHIHLEGTLEPETILRLAGQNNIELPWPSLQELRAQYNFSNLQSFLDLFYANMAVLRTAADFQEITTDYLLRAHESGVRHVELFFDPQAHLERGLTLTEVIAGIRAGLEAGQARWGITHRLIACFWRHAPAESAMEILRTLVQEKHAIDGIGLDSSELGYPPILFQEVFAYARENGLHVVAHAGEEGPAEYIVQALDLLKVERIDHGIRCLEDPALVQRLVAEQMPLTVCPFSNVRLRAVDTLADHPLRQMLDLGLKVSIHSDDPAYFGGYLDANFAAVIGQFNLSREDQAVLARNSIEASFLDAPAKDALLGDVDAWLESR